LAPQAEEALESGAMRALTILTTLIMVWGIAFVFAALEARSTGLTDSIVDMVSGK
jgi:hypothetical protein